jgi:alkanesulfonate monooxygenase SsuD/methylene tetrahydromethanopterin reductase-like flavin-dependent oxidoreductase (luciferase family)
VAEKADGWVPSGIPIPVMKDMWAGIKSMAAAAGRDPDALALVVRANVVLTSKPIGDHRPPFVGDAAQVRADIQATREAGAHEIAFDVQATRGAATVGDQIALLEQLWELSR